MKFSFDRKMIKKLIFSMIIIIFMSISPHYADAQNHSNLYDVKSGDTLWRIANRYNTSIENLKLSNGLQSDLIYVGQRLFVPMAYKVVSGYTLWKLSREYNSTVQAIKTANGLTSDIIYIGQKIKIPPKKLTMQGQYVLMTKEEFRSWLFNHIFTRKISIIQQRHTWRPITIVLMGLFF
ncbi:LysM peptidoglycan-binding domain-containing protein [Alkalihalobacterium elongatum]|uniref:LysM peptidoglycan-binding domain-containing protein n=1 Tax=Alkalihalobacterium elongatum TaxID=2675466 RepID=UPI001F42BD35|nr:LysM peptidoglycan-binding domain-containing protein [Alkalihalobacterium elongatum]